VGFSKAMSAGWVVMDKSSGQPIIKKKVDSIEDVVQLNLSQLLKGSDKMTDEQKQEYKKRKLLQEVVIKGFYLTKGPEFSVSISKPETDLTPEMIAQGTWKSKQFKDYNLGALGVPPPCGHLHPLLKVRSEFRQIFLEMGYIFLIYELDRILILKQIITVLPKWQQIIMLRAPSGILMPFSNPSNTPLVMPMTPFSCQVIISQCY
jgi:phenylalanyl-tRNA synthetase alpha subunit